jgi:branched-chain amino acid transport system permease protein
VADLRRDGIAFAMVTLAFAQAGAILVQKNPRGWSCGEEGLGYDFEKVPQTLVGILNTKHLYWLALRNAVLVDVLGLRPFPLWPARGGA